MLGHQLYRKIWCWLPKKQDNTPLAVRHCLCRHHRITEPRSSVDSLRQLRFRQDPHINLHLIHGS
jgi:hypothetical protein